MFLVTIWPIVDAVHAQAERDPENIFIGDDPLFVSLGSACETSWRMNLLGFRRASFPFDWLISVGPDTIVPILKDNFAFFLDEVYFAPHPYIPDVIVNQRYHIQ